MGTSDITFNQFSSTGDIQAGNGLTKTGETLNIAACDVNGHYTINGGSINGTTIGATSEASGKFTTLEAPSITGALTGNADTATKIASITNSDIVQLTPPQTLINKTLTSPTITGTLTAGGEAGTSGYVLQSTGAGINW